MTAAELAAYRADPDLAGPGRRGRARSRASSTPRRTAAGSLDAARGRPPAGPAAARLRRAGRSSARRRVALDARLARRPGRRDRRAPGTPRTTPIRTSSSRPSARSWPDEPPGEARPACETWRHARDEPGSAGSSSASSPARSRARSSADAPPAAACRTSSSASSAGSSAAGSPSRWASARSRASSPRSSWRSSGRSSSGSCSTRSARPDRRPGRTTISPMTDSPPRHDRRSRRARRAAPTRPASKASSPARRASATSTASAGACSTAATGSATSWRTAPTRPSRTCCGPATGIPATASRPRPIPPAVLTVLRALPATTKPMDALRTAVSAWGATQDLPWPPTVEQARAAHRVLAVGAGGLRPAARRARSRSSPIPSLDLVAGFLYQLTGSAARCRRRPGRSTRTSSSARSTASTPRPSRRGSSPRPARTSRRR